MNLEEMTPYLKVYDFLTDELGIKRIRKIGNDYAMVCPNPNHIDKVTSCFFNPQLLIYHCFGCHAKGNIVTLIKHYKKFKYYREAFQYLKNYLGLDDENYVADYVHSREDTEEETTYQLSSFYRRDWNNAPEEMKQYAINRRFNLELFSKYFIGYNLNLNSVTLPIIHDKKIVNIGERFLNPTVEESKIKYKKGSKLSNCLWGIQNGFKKERPYFAEGVFDAIRLIEAGYNAFALLSNQLPDEKIRIIQEVFPGEELTIVPDNDQGGRDMINNWRVMLNSSIVNVMLITGAKDADEATPSQLRDMKKIKLIDYIMPTATNNGWVCNTINR